MVCWLEGATDKAADEATGEALDAAPEAAGAVLLLDEDEADPVSPPTPFTALQVPVNEPELSATLSLFVTSASGPGFGNWTSLPSTVVQPLPRLATNRSGRLEYAVAGALVLEPELTVTDAQLI